MTYKRRLDQATHYYPTELSRGNYTLEQIAEMMGLTRERVRQIEANALRKLRRELRRRGLDDKALLLPDNNDSSKY
jgi:DNA-directed RNA polymerase sigma subunit (sigma70/sigma32)